MNGMSEMSEMFQSHPIATAAAQHSVQSREWTKLYIARLLKDDCTSHSWEDYSNIASYMDWICSFTGYPDSQTMTCVCRCIDMG